MNLHGGSRSTDRPRNAAGDRPLKPEWDFRRLNGRLRRSIPLSSQDAGDGDKSATLEASQAMAATCCTIAQLLYM
jgi:hypothetical protein